MIANPATERPTIVVVEDTLDDEILTLRGLKRAGVIGNVYRDGEAALEHLFKPWQVLPILVLLDYRLPTLGGGEVLTELRKKPWLSCVPIVVFSSSLSAEQVRGCRTKGANACMIKPLDPQLYVADVTSMVRYWLNANLPERVQELPRVADSSDKPQAIPFPFRRLDTAKMQRHVQA